MGSIPVEATKGDKGACMLPLSFVPEPLVLDNMGNAAKKELILGVR